MPQVPYRGYPEGGPENVPLRPEVPGALLEGSRAIQAFGQDIKGAGNEIWNEAVRLKQLDNETEAIEADSKYMVRVGKLHADFNALQGEDRVKAYPKFQSDLVTARQEIRAGLSNDDARRRYDFSSLRTQAHGLSDGARTAATAEKDWAKTSTAANVGIAKQDYSNNPSPATLAKIEAGSRRHAGLTYGGGTDSEVADYNAEKDVSDAIVGRIQTTARHDAPEAKKLMIDNWARLTPDDKRRADSLVTSQATHQGAELIANDIVRWAAETPDQPAKSLDEQMAEARKRVKEEDPKGELPDLEKTTVAAVQRNDYINRNAKAQFKNQLHQDMIGVITANNPTSIPEFVQDQKGFEIYKKMDPRTRDKEIQSEINSWYSREGQAERKFKYEQLLSLSTTNAGEFMSKPPGEWGIKAGTPEWKGLMAQRDKILKHGAINDPRVDAAMSVLKEKYGQTLLDMQVLDKGVKSTNYHIFRGSLAAALDSWQDDPANKGKKITKKDIQEDIWPQLRAETAEPRTFMKDVFGTGYNIPGWWGGWEKKTPEALLPLPTDNPRLIEELDDEIKKRRPEGVYTITDEERRLEWQRYRFDRYRKQQGQ